MKVRLSFLVIASLVSLATSQSETAVRPVVSMAIVDGKDSDMGEHPWHVGLVREKSGFGGFLGLSDTTYFGATLINPRWFITAAHCIKEHGKSQVRPEELQAVMGSNKRARYFYYFWQTESVSEIHIHPKYNETGESRFDIALIRLATNQELERSELWPVCLPSSPVDSYADTSVTVIGWGKLKREEDKSSARTLQRLEGRVISQESCQSQRTDITIGGPKMCFTSEKGAPCSGDSGGGMYTRDGNNTVHLIGVCSLGPVNKMHCIPGSTKVYTKLAHPQVLDWIRETIGVEELSMENCGVTNPAVRISESLIDKIKDFFKGRQVI